MDMTMTRQIMSTIVEIQEEMNNVSKTDFILNLDDFSVLFSIYFLDNKKDISGNSKISKILLDLKSTLNIHSLSVGKTVTLYGTTI